MNSNPFIPKNKANLIAVNSDYNHLFDGFGIETIAIKGDEHLPRYIRNHPDLNIFNAEKTLFLSNGIAHSDKLKIHFDKEIKRVVLGESYNKYNKLNAFVLSNTIFGNINILDENLVLQYKNAVNTKQSYAKCSTAIINDNAVITDDTDIYNLVLKSGFDALLISKGDIKLETKDYGFIGGATGLIAKDILAFAGNCKNHKNYIIMKDFARNHNCFFESICKGDLLDIGGILSIL